MTLRRHLGPVAAGVFGFLAGGLLGAVVGVVAVNAARDQRRLVSFTARIAPVVLIVVAALATMLEAPIGRSDIGSDYATARDLASTSSRLAAIVVFALVVAAAQRTRAPSPSVAPPATAPLTAASSPTPPATSPVATPVAVQPDDTPGLERLAAWQYLALAAAAATVRILLAPAPLATIHAEVANAIERGIAYGRPAGLVIRETAWVSPLAPITAVAAPFGPRFALIAIGSVTVVAIAASATRLCGARIGRWAGMVGVVAPVLWAQQLPAALVTALVCAALLGWSRDERRFGRPFWTGVLIGLAVLASPAAIVALIVCAAMVAPSPRRRDLAVFAAGAIVVLAPWQAWVTQNFDTVLPTTSAAPTLAAATDPSVRWGTDLGAVAPFAVPAPDEESAATADAAASVASRIAWNLYPPLIVTRAMRAWDLWWPMDTTDQRNQRDLPNPGGAVAAAAQGIIAILALGAIARHRGRRLAGPIVVAFIIAATVGAGITFGEREVVVAAAPVVVIAAAVQLSMLATRWRSSPCDADGTATDKGDVSAPKDIAAPQPSDTSASAASEE